MTKTQIANIALGLIGARRIADITDQQSVEAQACQTHFDITFRSLLRRHQWSFGTRRIPVTLEAANQAASSITGTANQAIRFTAAVPGPQGNEITRSIVIDDQISRAQLSIAVANKNITITAGDKHTLNNTFGGVPFTLIPSGETSIDNAGVEWPVWTTGGIPIAQLSGDLIAFVRAQWSGFALFFKINEATQLSSLPSFIPDVGAADWPDVVIEGLTAHTPSANFLIVAIRNNPQATALVNVSPATGSTGEEHVTADNPQFFTGGTGPASSEFSHSYDLPADFIRLIRLATTDPHNPIRSFAIEGRRLLTNSPSFELVYISANCLDELDETFVDALTISLASKIAADVAADPQLKQSLLAQLESLHLPAATNADAKEVASGENFGPRALASMSSLVQARFATRNSSIQRPTLP